MERPPHDYAAAAAAAAAMAFAQQQQQQQQFGFHPQAQQFPQQLHGPPFMHPHPSLQQFPFHRPLVQQQQLYPRPPHPMLHLQQQQQAPPAFQPHLPSHPVPPSAFVHPFDSAPPPAAPPHDPELHKRIDKLAEYAAKNGPEFEAMIREKQQDNPEYSFLFGGEGHNYYRYKLWLITRAPGSAFNPSFPSTMPMVPSLHNPLINASPLNHPPIGGPGSVMHGPQLQQPPFASFYDQHQQPGHSQALLGRASAEYEPSSKSFKGLAGPLPPDVAAELNNVLSNLSGTKESIKGAKAWFMQRAPFAPGLVEALRERIFELDDSERQLHIIFLVNDILFDSLQRRHNPHELDNEALAFISVLGSMLSRIYNNPQNKEANQSRLEKILNFWASKEVYDQETIHRLEGEMTGALPLHAAMQKEPSSVPDPSTFPATQQTSQSGFFGEQGPEKQIPPVSLPLPQFTGPAGPQPFLSNQLPGAMFPHVSQSAFAGSAPTGLPTVSQPPIPPIVPSKTDQIAPPYPLFPPGLIPGMVKKLQIGSGVPYSPLSPLDIPTVIPPSTIPQSEVLDRVAKFFKEIGEVNPSEGPMNSSEPNYDDYESEPPVRKGGACIPPPSNLQQVDPETGMYADGSVERKPNSTGSAHLGLGASANPNEISQYDDVYTSYRKQRSTNYHSSMSSRASAR